MTCDSLESNGAIERRERAAIRVEGVRKEANPIVDRRRSETLYYLLRRMGPMLIQDADMDGTAALLDALQRFDICPCVAVACRRLAPLIRYLAPLPDRRLILPAREEEGLGICAGAHLSGYFPVLIMQNSGLGNLVNAYCSLNQFFEIPLFFIISHRGDKRENVAAQRPMGSITRSLLDLLRIQHDTLSHPGCGHEINTHLAAYREHSESRALLLTSGFWD